MDQYPFNQSGSIIGAVLATLAASGAGVWGAFRLYRIISSSGASTDKVVTVDTN